MIARSLGRSNRSLIRLLIRSLPRSLTRSLTRSGAHGKEVFVNELNASISHHFNPQRGDGGKFFGRRKKTKEDSAGMKKTRPNYGTNGNGQLAVLMKNDQSEMYGYGQWPTGRHREE